MKGKGGNLKAHYYKTEANLKGLHYCMNPNRWCSGKGKAMTAKKRMYVLCSLVLTVNLTQMRITWGESFDKELHRANWPVSMSGVGGFVNRCRKT